MAKKPLGKLVDELKVKLNEREEKIKYLVDKGNNNTATTFQIVGWSAAAFVGGLLLGGFIF